MAFLQRQMNRGSVSTGYEIDHSISFDKNTNESLYRTPSSSGNQRTFTFSAWVKFSHINTGVSDWSTLYSAGDYTSTGPSFRIGHHTNNSLQVSFYTNSAYTGYYRTDALFRDTNAWYHFVCAIDTTQGTDTNRVKIYVNGVQAPTTATVSHISQNYDTGVNTAIQHELGLFTSGGNPTAVASEYIAETHLIDGQALAPTEFGEFDEDSGIWKPKKYTGSYGTNGVYLDYADAGDLGDDESGNGNDYTEYNMDASDQATDTPTNNFATLNPVFAYSASSGANPIITEGATVLTTQNSGYWHNSVSTIPVTSGKWYFEAQPGTSSTHVTAIGYGDEQNLYTWGVANSHVGASSTKSNAYLGSDTAGSSYGRIFPADSSPSTRVNYTSSNIIGVAIDADNGYVYWAKDNTWINSGDPTSGSSGTGGYAVPSGTGTNGILIPSIAAYHHTSLGKMFINFGGYTTISISSSASDANGYGTFEYAPPTGYYALCGKNLAEYG